MQKGVRKKMTESEAIKSALKKVEAQQDNLGGFMDRFDIPEHWAVRNALEKQIPKKPKTDDRYIMHICPWCNDFVKVSHNYCQNCGQKLDWGDEE